MSRYAYAYSLTRSRPTGWRGAFASVIVFTTVMAVSAISGALVTLELFAPTAPAAASTPVAAAVAPAAPAVRQVAMAPVPQHVSAPAASNEQAQQPATVAVALADRQAPAAPPPAVAAVPPPAAIAESDLTFAKGYAARHGQGVMASHGGKIVVAAAAKARPKPKVYARNRAADRRPIPAAHAEAYGMLQRFDRPSQFDFTRHQALAFGEQRLVRQRNYSPPPAAPYGNSPNGLFGGLF